MTDEAGGDRKRLSLEDRLYLLQFRSADASHLALRAPSACAGCGRRPCTTVCPAGVYSWLAQGHGEAGPGSLLIAYENCLECGACRIICPEGNVLWRYPQGDHGVSFRYG